MRRFCLTALFAMIAVLIASCGNHFVEEIVKISDLDEVVVQQGQQGEAGSVVTIGDNGNWFIDGTDTGVKAGTNDIYMVTFNADGGYPAPKTHIVVVGGYVINEPAAMSKQYHEFAGWYYDADFSEEVKFPVTVNDNVEFWAMWIQLPI